MLGEDVLYLPVTELARRIQGRQLSPVELTESYLARIRKVFPEERLIFRLCHHVVYIPLFFIGQVV